MKNVILLTIDALRQDMLECYGGAAGLSPFIGSLVDKSIIFTNTQSTGPYTQASFPGILASSYFLDYGKPSGLSPKRTLIAEVLKRQGIVTAGFHSNPYCSAYFGWNRGWDVFYDSMQDEPEPDIPYIRGDKINAKVDQWLSSFAKSAAGKPFFLWVHFMDIHEPYVPEQQYVDQVDASIRLTRAEMLDLFQNVLLKRDVSDVGKVALLRKLYQAHVGEVDDYIREFFGILGKYGLLPNSVVIITSDHGDEFGEHGGLSHDDKMYTELINVPLIIYGHNENRGTICNTLVSSVDISPTIVYLFGLAPVAAFAGRSLLPLEAYPKKGSFSEAIDQKSQRGGDINRDVYCYREGDLKVIYRANMDAWEMYDLKADPKEVNNIVGTSPMAEDLKMKLKPRVRRWLES